MPTPIPETLVFRSIAQQPREAPAVRPSASPKRPRLNLALYTLAHLGGVL